MLNFSLTSYFASVLQIGVTSEMNPLSCNHRENCLKQDAVMLCQWYFIVEVTHTSVSRMRLLV